MVELGETRLSWGPSLGPELDWRYSRPEASFICLHVLIGVLPTWLTLAEPSRQLTEGVEGGEFRHRPLEELLPQVIEHMHTVLPGCHYMRCVRL